jgi:hypothetical protein
MRKIIISVLTGVLIAALTSTSVISKRSYRSKNWRVKKRFKRIIKPAAKKHMRKPLPKPKVRAKRKLPYDLRILLRSIKSSKTIKIPRMIKPRN